MAAVLIVSPLFVPYCPSYGGAVRALTLSHFLREQGFEVHILATGGQFYGYFGAEHLVDSACCHYLPWILTPQHTSGGTSARKFLAETFCVPDGRVRQVPALTLAAARLIRQHSIKHLITTSPPHSCQLVGLLLKLLLGDRLNWIVDYRDSWNQITRFARNNAIARALSRFLERRVLSACDYFTYVSSPILRKLEGQIEPGRARLVSNGFWDAPPQRPYRRQPGALSIGHFGVLDRRYRDPKGLLLALEQLPGWRDSLEFHFFGASPEFSHPWLQFHPTLSSQEAATRMTEMDYLLVLHSESIDCDEAVTGKFYEYLAARRPLLCLAPPASEVYRQVRELGVGVTADIDDPTQVARLLSGLPPPQSFTQIYQELDVERFSRRRQFEVFLELCGRACASDGPDDDRAKPRPTSLPS